jgi:hypothetical protein
VSDEGELSIALVITAMILAILLVFIEALGNTGTSWYLSFILQPDVGAF